MPTLEFTAVTRAFNAIGATNSQGKPYANAHGVSVSADGRHFRFWEDEVIFPDEHTMELYRPPPKTSTWREGDGKSFYKALVAARDSSISVYVAINRRGRTDRHGKSVAKNAAPVLTSAGKPAPGRVLFVDPESGEARLRVSLSASSEAPSFFVDQVGADSVSPGKSVPEPPHACSGTLPPLGVAEDVVAILNDQNTSPTQKETLISARLGQGGFRRDVLKRWEQRCSVTGSSTLVAIRASHIKPWRVSNDQERLDPNNGLALVANLDALFDAGLISFDLSGTLIVSPQLDSAERQRFGLSGQSLRLRKVPLAASAVYLLYHRNNVFRR